MTILNTLLFVAIPYIALTMFIMGHAARYLIDRYGWTSRSSEFLEKKRLFLGITLFHWGMLMVLFGHLSGLLIPQRFLDLLGINAELHTFIAHYSGMITGLVACIGLGLLLYRRISIRRIQVTTTVNDYIVLSALLLVSLAGMYNVLFAEYHILDTIAPWIRSIVLFTPEPELMRPVPISYKIHIVGALVLLAFSPFTRLVHIWSVPLGYFSRSWILFRRKIVQ